MLVANAMQMFMAGYETTSTILSMALYHLAKNPSVQERLRQEVEDHAGSGDNKDFDYNTLQNKLPYLDAVLKEASRSWPLTVVERECVKDYKVPGTDFVIPKGMLVQLPTMAIMQVTSCPIITALKSGNRLFKPGLSPLRRRRRPAPLRPRQLLRPFSPRLPLPVRLPVLRPGPAQLRGDALRHDDDEGRAGEDGARRLRAGGLGEDGGEAGGGPALAHQPAQGRHLAQGQEEELKKKCLSG